MKRDDILQAPFARLLLPLLAGILLQYYLNIKQWSIILFTFGVGLMLFSFFIPEKHKYPTRWLFGCGVSLFIVVVGVFFTYERQQKIDFLYSPKPQSHYGIVLDLPQHKPNSLACRVQLKDVDKRVICYLEPDGVSESLQPGDAIRFYGLIEPFRNMGNPDDFDYAAYMRNQGYVGSLYLPVDRWEPMFETHHTIGTYALSCRSQIMRFYGSLGLDSLSLAVVSALTVGYRDTLPNDLKESFRATGTAHVLAVSGMHVLIVFAVIRFLLSFISRGSRFYWIKPVLTILLLWMYAFVTGLPPSVIRACLMLSVFCVGEVIHRKGFSYNTILLTAFFMLIYNPLNLFDVGFQLSFTAVLSIRYLYPKLIGLWAAENKAALYFRNVAAMSVAAQVGTLPVCLYHFGYFPTYFFVCNLFVVPLVEVIVYTTLVTAVMGLFIPVTLLARILNFIIELLTSGIRFFETLPFAKLEVADVSLLTVVLLFVLIIGFTGFFVYKRAKLLIVGLSAVALLILTSLPDKLKTEGNSLIVYNRRASTEIRLVYENKEHTLTGDSLDAYKLLGLGGKRFLSVTGNKWEGLLGDERFAVTYLHLYGNDAISLTALNDIIRPDTVILDGSFSAKTTKRLVKECCILNIPCFDIKESGAFKINF
ncbi:competence protein ComEC [Dysgonomonas sp. PH5-45]|uniref:ComEC/Rec2 family competence protein n=1 Tax=unclassified Dysgonomonas TaxID=2630389 RepID=UPI002472FCD8|nr:MULTISPECIES: ComEC/Rec2 family competence protein [unclassified Dysgonomonas]MDH6355646.1 competence protein ComEC [Dysgonomonas sp. PH5-45]MDH6388543.1 competence protein ComEC [Dysgonomonas sp. PH5-37]